MAGSYAGISLSGVPAPTTPPVAARRAALDALSREPFDVLVVGGGITGAGVARDADAGDPAADDEHVEPLVAETLDSARALGERRRHLVAPSLRGGKQVHSCRRTCHAGYHGA